MIQPNQIHTYSEIKIRCNLKSKINANQSSTDPVWCVYKTNKMLIDHSVNLKQINAMTETKSDPTDCFENIFHCSFEFLIKNRIYGQYPTDTGWER